MAKTPTAQTGAKKIKDAQRYAANRERMKKQAAEYKEANAEDVRLKNAAYMRKRRATSDDVQFKYRDEQRRMFSKLMKPHVRITPSVIKMASWVGCPIGQLRQELTSQFQPEWGWHNYGVLWVIDHIEPLVAHDLTTDGGARAAWNHKNLRPLSKRENAEKSGEDITKRITP